MMKRIAEEWMIHVYYMFSAVVSLDEEGCCLAVRMFDTCFGSDCMAVHPKAARICLLSNHPEGYKEPYPQDLENMKALRKLADGKEIRLMITGEDIGCMEVHLPAGSGM